MLAQKSSGYAIILALWLIIILTTIALSVSLHTRTETKSTAYHLHSTQARLLADSGINHAIWRLLNSDIIGIEHYAINYANAHIDILIQDEAGKIDLNTGHADLLFGLLLQFYPRDKSQAIRDMILDWRDADSQKRLYGAEDHDYIAANMKNGARDGAFIALQELSQVLGVDTAIADTLMPNITIYNGQIGIRSESANRNTLLAVPSSSVASVDSYIEARQQPEQYGARAPTFFLPSPYGNAQAGLFWSVTSTAYTETATHKMNIVLKLAKTSEKKKYRIVSHTEGLSVNAKDKPEFNQ